MRATVAPEATDTRQRLLDAAMEVFSEQGYDGARVQEIARRAGLTTGAIYGRFRGKADLLMEAIGARSADELDRLIPSDAKPSAAQLLSAMGKDLMKGRATSRQALLVEALVAARRDPELARRVKASIEERTSALRRALDAARKRGGLAVSVDTDTLATFGFALALGALLFKAIDLDRPEGDRWDDLIDRLVDALANDSGEATAT